MGKKDNTIPEILYRGIGICLEKLEEFNFYGVDLINNNKPYKDENGNIYFVREGRKLKLESKDGNEYGVYMTDNLKMVESAYGAGRGNEKLLSPIVRIGQPPVPISLPGLGVIYKINTQGFEVRFPYISQAYQGHYNNGFVGDEYITEAVPAQNYQIMKIIIGRDFLHDKEDLEITDIHSIKDQILDVIDERRERLETFKDAIQNLSEKEKSELNYIMTKNLFREIFAKNGAKYMSYEEIDIKSTDDLIKYLLHENCPEKISSEDFVILKYIYDFKNKIKKYDNLEAIEGMTAILKDEYELLNQKIDRLIEQQKSTKGFNKKIIILKKLIYQMQKIERLKTDVASFNEEYTDFYSSPQKR